MDSVFDGAQQGCSIVGDLTHNTHPTVAGRGAVSLVLLAGFMGFAATRRKQG